MRIFGSALLFLLSIFASAKERTCQLPPRPLESTALEAWRRYHFSDIAHFRQDQFSFLVSAMPMNQTYFYKIDGHVELKRSVIYSTLINQNYRYSFGTVGVILAPPRVDQINEAIPYDSQSRPCNDLDCSKTPFSEVRATLALFRKHRGIYLPDQLLKPILPRQNEVIVSTTSKTDHLRVAGIFLIVDSKGKALSWESKDEEKEAKQLADLYHLPLIRITRDDFSPGLQFPPQLKDCRPIAPEAPRVFQDSLIVPDDAAH